MLDSSNILDDTSESSEVSEDWEVLSANENNEDTPSIGAEAVGGKQTRNETFASLDLSVISMESRPDSVIDDIDQHTVSTHRETLADLEDAESEIGSIAVSPLVQPLIRQTSTESTSSAYNVSAGFDTEWNVKQRRGETFNKSNLCRGKTRRRKCNCRSCRSYLKGIVETTLSRVDASIRQESTGPKAYPITEFDLMGLPQSMEKSENWSLLRDALSSVATSRTEVNSTRLRSDVRKVEVFDVEIIGSIVTPQAQFKHEQDVERREHARAWKSFREGAYYVVRELLHYSSFTAQDTMDFYHAVRALKIPQPAQLQPDEVFIRAMATFESWGTAQDFRTTMTSGSMISACRVTDEIGSISRGILSTSSSTRSETNRMRCWASEPARDSEFGFWFLNLDLGEEREVTAVIMQGRAPAIEQFPSPQLFKSAAECQKYKGPIWPVVVGGTDGQWVKRVEIYARGERGGWFTVGEFRANDDCYTEVRIDLPFNHHERIRYLSIRPLSKLKGGFHGEAPAMRCAVVGINNRGPIRPVRATRNDEVPKDFIRYELKVPDAAVEGVRKDTKYVAGRAIDYCSMSKWYSRDKSEGSRFLKKKTWHAMLSDADTYFG